MAKCYCKLCCEGRIIDGIVASGNRELMTRVIRRLQNELCCTGEELDVKTAILNGSWPTSIQQLAKAISKAAEFHRKD